MNPRARQFALGNRLGGWVRREAFNAEEAAVLRRCYSGREPRTISRYGVRQWRAPWPGTRIIIKDPFALLSCAAIGRTTGALPVLIYRHPAAVLASYRRMGWAPDIEELISLGAPAPAGPGDLEAMATMWSWCHGVALGDLKTLADAVVVSHHTLMTGRMALSRLRHRLGLTAPSGPTREEGELRRSPGTEPVPGVLHDFTRSPAELETGWRATMDAAEITAIERRVAPIWQALEALQMPIKEADHKLGDT